MASAVKVLESIKTIEWLLFQSRSRVEVRQNSLERAEKRGDKKQAWADKVMIGREERAQIKMIEDRKSLLFTGKPVRI